MDPSALSVNTASPIHPFNKDFLSTCHGPDIGLGQELANYSPQATDAFYVFKGL